MAWVAQQDFWSNSLQKQVLADYREAVELAGAPCSGRLTARMAEAVETWEKRASGQGKAFQGAAGIDLVKAVARPWLVTEVGDFRRFATAGELMAFVGLVPSEHSSGGSRRQGRTVLRAIGQWPRPGGSCSRVGLALPPPAADEQGDPPPQ
jgi:transposase